MEKPETTYGNTRDREASIYFLTAAEGGRVATYSMVIAPSFITTVMAGMQFRNTPITDMRILGKLPERICLF